MKMTYFSALWTACTLLIGINSAKAATVWSCPSGTVQCAIDLTSADYAMLTDTRIWVEGSGAAPGQFALRLEDTNPTFFALVFNSLKDQKVNGHSGFVRVYYFPNFAGASGTYNKISQIGIQ